MNFIKRNIYVIAAAVCVVAIGALYAVQSYKPQALAVAADSSVVLYDSGGDYLNGGENVPANPDASSEPPEAPEPALGLSEKIFVYISGQVALPGVYELPSDSRVNDVLELAGGFTAEADKNRVNLAAKVSDEEHIAVPAIGEAAVSVSPEDYGGIPASEASDVSSGGLVNINTADSHELQTLSGVGETIAGYIITYREANGGFKSTDEILNVERIGTVTYDKIKDKITVK